MNNVTAYQSLQNQLDSIDMVMRDAPGNFFIKDLKGRYLYHNMSVEGLAGESLLGKTDVNTPWAEYAALCQENDKQALQSKNCLAIQEIGEIHNKKIKIFSSQKQRFYLDEKLVGVWGMSIEIPFQLLNSDPLLSQKTVVVDVKKACVVALTDRRKEVLYWTLKGYSAKAVGNRLGLSKRTVESHLLTIKDVNGYNSLKEMKMDLRVI